MECSFSVVGLATLLLVFTPNFLMIAQLPAAEAGGLIGVEYGLFRNELSPTQTVALLHSKNITRVRRFEARPSVTLAFADAGINLLIGVPNEDVATLAASADKAKLWVQENVLPFPSSGISAIIVGNQWLYNPFNDPSHLLPAMENIHDALVLLAGNITTSFLADIKVSTCHAFNVIRKFFPPSAATFKKSVVSVMAPLLDFLDRTDSFFMVDIFPYLLAAENPQDKALLQFILFNSTQVVVDPYTHLNYTNMFDLQLDAVYAAIDSLMAMSPSSSASSSSCVCSCVCMSFSSCVCSSTSNASSSSPASTEVSPSCDCTAQYHMNSNEDIYHTSTSAHTKRRMPTYTGSGYNNGHGPSGSSTPRAPPPRHPTRGEKIDENSSATKLSSQPSKSDDKLSPLLSSSYINATEALPDAQLTSGPGMSFPFTLLDYNEMNTLQHELKPLKNGSVLTGPASGFSIKTPRASSTRVHILPLASPSSSSSSITNAVSSSSRTYRSSRRRRAPYVAKYNQSLGYQYYHSSSATSYWDACSSNAVLQQVATIENAETYNQNLINHVLQANGTPANPTTPITAYIFELFDEGIRGQHYGFYYPNGTAVYPLTFVEEEQDCTCSHLYYCTCSHLP